MLDLNNNTVHDSDPKRRSVKAFFKTLMNKNRATEINKLSQYTILSATD